MRKKFQEKVNFLLKEKSLVETSLILLISASVFALIFAYISQYFFNLQPCILCLYQRKPFFIVVTIILLSWIFFKKPSQQKFILAICLIMIAINLGIAIYHSGVEKKLFAGPTTCSSQGLNEINDVEKLAEAIKATKAIRCDEPQFFFLKLTMANWNVIYCFSLIMLSLALLRKTKKL